MIAYYDKYSISKEEMPDSISFEIDPLHLDELNKLIQKRNRGCSIFDSEDYILIMKYPRIFYDHKFSIRWGYMVQEVNGIYLIVLPNPEMYKVLSGEHFNQHALNWLRCLHEFLYEIKSDISSSIDDFPILNGHILSIDGDKIRFYISILERLRKFRVDEPCMLSKVSDTYIFCEKEEFTWSIYSSGSLQGVKEKKYLIDSMDLDYESVKEMFNRF